MKRQLLTLGVVLMTFQAVWAQIGEHRSELAVGVNGGYILSRVGFMPKVPQNMHMGLTGGLTVRYTSEKYFSSICAIVAELNYAQIGWKEKLLTPDDLPVINSVTGVAEEFVRDISYVQVPVFARLGWGRERHGIQAFFQVGPQVGVYLNDKITSNFLFADRNMAERTSPVVVQDTMTIENKFDYGIAVGAGIEFSHHRIGHFMLEGRYYYGLGNIYGNSKRDYFGISNYSNIVIKLTYLFDIARTSNSKIK